MISADAILKSIADSHHCVWQPCCEVQYLSIRVEADLYLNLRIERTQGDWKFERKATFPWFDLVSHRGPDKVRYRFDSSATTFYEESGTLTPITDARPFVDAVKAHIDERAKRYQGNCLRTFERKTQA